ncbi:MAG: GDSL-type esterase/lipase family protein [Oscillospiraceae bacterium]|nr:GDSL-type esterase/lipase family protein [Oscillospiraceae bacterium]
MIPKDSKANTSTSYSVTVAAPIGRTIYHTDSRTLWCAHSGTGIAFGFQGLSCTLTLVTDSSFPDGETILAKYAVYVNNMQIICRRFSAPCEHITIPAEADSSGFTWVRILKISESAFSAMGIQDLQIQSSEKETAAVVPVPHNNHLIEFIGDSITCGYGIDGTSQDSFSTDNENITKSYAFLTAEMLHADYSMVCFSGYGIISGYTPDGIANTRELLPGRYEPVGYCGATLPSAGRIQDYPWNFSRQPDLIVINMGTNDASYTGEDAARQQCFIQQYVLFLKTVRSLNTVAEILCTLGIMGGKLCSEVQKAVDMYTDETNDSRVQTMWFPEQQEQDGYGVDWHPSAATHAKAADKLTAFIRTKYHW